MALITAKKKISWLLGVHKACPCFDATELQGLLKVRNMDELDVWLAQHQEWVRGEASLKEESEANLRKEVKDGNQSRA